MNLRKQIFLKNIGIEKIGIIIFSCFDILQDMVAFIFERG
jgi:hypothetical protein